MTRCRWDCGAETCCLIHMVLLISPQNVTASIKGEDQNTTTFRSLHWGDEYCVSVRVQDKASKSVSTVSPKQCVLLPEQGNRIWKKNHITSDTRSDLQLLLTFVLCFVPPHRVGHNCCDIPLVPGCASLRLHHRSHPPLLPETSWENSRCFGENI